MQKRRWGGDGPCHLSRCQHHLQSLSRPQHLCKSRKLKEKDQVTVWGWRWCIGRTWCWAWASLDTESVCNKQEIVSLFLPTLPACRSSLRAPVISIWCCWLQNTLQFAKLAKLQSMSVSDVIGCKTCCWLKHLLEFAKISRCLFYKNAVDWRNFFDWLIAFSFVPGTGSAVPGPLPAAWLSRMPCKHWL